MKNIATVILILSVFLVAVASAQEQQTGESCGKIDGSETRLRCYDSIFKPTLTTKTPTQSTGKWRISTETSPIDDSTKVFLLLSGDNGITNRYGQEAQIRFMIACRENTTSLWFSFGGNFMSDNQGQGRITYRIDSNQAQRKSFRVSNDNEALGLWPGSSSIPFIKALFGGERLYVQATPYNENSISDFFSIGGLEEAIKPLREACHW